MSLTAYLAQLFGIYAALIGFIMFVRRQVMREMWVTLARRRSGRGRRSLSSGSGCTARLSLADLDIKTRAFVAEAYLELSHAIWCGEI